MDFIVKYSGIVIGNVKNNHYFPDDIGIAKVRGETIFSFLKEEIKDITEVNFFSRRMESCERFGNYDVSYAGDNYEFEFKK